LYAYIYTYITFHGSKVSQKWLQDVVYAIKMQTIYVWQKLCFHIKYTLRVHVRYSNVSNRSTDIHQYCELMLLIYSLKSTESFFLATGTAQETRTSGFKYYFSAILNCACSFIRLLRLDHRSLKMFMTTQHALFWQEWLINWYMKRVAFPCVMCTAELVWKCSWLFTIKFINENIHTYSHGTG
jgi:hypothetical protein